MKFLDFYFVLFSLYFNFIVTLCCNLSIKCISQLERSPESSLSFPIAPLHTYYTQFQQVFNVSWTQLAILYFYVCVYVAPSFWDVFMFLSKFYSCTKAKMSPLSVKPSKGFCPPLLSHFMEKASMASITLCLCIYYTLFYGSTSVCLPLNPALRGQELGDFLHLYTSVLSSRITPRRGVFKPSYHRSMNSQAFDIKVKKWSDVVYIKCILIVHSSHQNKQKENTHSLKAIRAVLW